MREEQLATVGEFAYGLTLWLRGDEGCEAEAASTIVAETMLMWRRVLEAKFKK